jgi:RNA polymerase sigma factor
MNKKNIEIPFCSFNFKSNKELEEQLNMFKDEEESNKYDIIYELDKFSKELEAFGLSLKNMPYYIPKHKDSKSMCLRIAKSIIQNPIIHDRLMAKKYFHMKELAKIIDVSEKTIRRNREFIICICIIYGNNYEILKTYLNELLL